MRIHYFVGQKIPAAGIVSPRKPMFGFLLENLSELSGRFAALSACDRSRLWRYNLNRYLKIDFRVSSQSGIAFAIPLVLLCVCCIRVLWKMEHCIFIEGDKTDYVCTSSLGNVSTNGR